MDPLQQLYQLIQSADVSGVSVVTPLQHSPKLSDLTQNNLYIKREDLQPVFSFKCRGAYNKIRQLSNRQRSQGIIAASAGNHAQGVAMSAQQLDIPATIVMPVTTPSIKVSQVQSFGVSVILHGDSYDEAYTHATALATEKDLVFIHPYDDMDVIAGQGTVGTEILEQLSEPIDYIFVAVGGGGLLAGILGAFKTLSPNTKVIAVEPDNSNCLAQAMAASERVILDTVGIFADGVAVRQIGEIPFSIIQPHVDDSICVSIDEICSSIKDIYNDSRIIVEPAGALSLAGVKKYIQEHNIQDQNIVTINCGANMNFDRLRHVAERSTLGEAHESLLSVQIPEKPGALKTFCKTIGDKTLTEFNYRFQTDKVAHIFVGIENNKDHPIEDTIQALTTAGYNCDNLSDNECAKLHVRHMVGGIPTPPIPNERIYRFQFPERPGALLDFLNALQNRWNITLFHYRNHGAAYGRVLVGLDVPQDQSKELDHFIEDIGFKAFDESQNPAIHLFCK